MDVLAEVFYDDADVDVLVVGGLEPEAVADGGVLHFERRALFRRAAHCIGDFCLIDR